jgi:hypothetical protein
MSSAEGNSKPAGVVTLRELNQFERTFYGQVPFLEYRRRALEFLSWERLRMLSKARRRDLTRAIRGKIFSAAALNAQYWSDVRRSFRELEAVYPKNHPQIERLLIVLARTALAFDMPKTARAAIARSRKILYKLRDRWIQKYIAQEEAIYADIEATIEGMFRN